MNNVAPAQSAPAADVPDANEKPGIRILKGSMFRVRAGHGWSFTEEPPPRLRLRSGAPHASFRPWPSPTAYRPRLIAATTVTEPRAPDGLHAGAVTQLLDLLLLGPDIAERILFLEAVDRVEPMAERALRDVVRHESCGAHRRAFAELPLAGSSHF